jgi:hypothetical protein
LEKVKLVCGGSHTRKNKKKGRGNMVVELPPQFLRWNYFPRRDMIKSFKEEIYKRDMSLFFLESTRHNPALCTAFAKPDGSIYVNAKIVGVGYVLKERFLSEATKALRKHVIRGDKLFSEAKTSEEKRKAMNEYQKRGILLLLRYLYLEPKEAKRKVDFTKLSTMELAKNKPYSSKHTWTIVQRNRTACLLFYRPPNISFELHGWLDVHENGAYHEFVEAVHDTFHYVPPEKRRTERPVYIFHVEEVYDNSPTPKGYGTKIA